MIDIITTYSKPYHVILYTEGMSFPLSEGFTDKSAANRCRTKWRRRWRNLPCIQKLDLLGRLQIALKSLGGDPQ